MFRARADILVACVDGLQGSPEAMSTLYPRMEVQLCIVHICATAPRDLPVRANFYRELHELADAVAAGTRKEYMQLVAATVPFLIFDGSA